MGLYTFPIFLNTINHGLILDFCPIFVSKLSTLSNKHVILAIIKTFANTIWDYDRIHDIESVCLIIIIADDNSDSGKIRRFVKYRKFVKLSDEFDLFNVSNYFLYLIF